MKVALCYSGQLRTGIHCIKNQLEFLGEHASADKFLHTWNLNTNKRFPPWRQISTVPWSEISRYTEVFGGFKQLIVEDPEKVGLFNRSRAAWLHDLSLYYSWKQSVLLALEGDYDVIVKIRPDMIFPPHRRLTDDLERAAEGIFLIDGLNWNPSWREATVTSDVYFVSSAAAAKVALGWVDLVYSRTHLGISMGNWLIEQGVPVEGTKHSGYAIYRPEAIGLDSVDRYFDVRNIDGRFYHYNPECFHPSYESFMKAPYNPFGGKINVIPAGVTSTYYPS